ncbi:aspartate carbamoyltransferase [Tetzosporium hominis]|uniref:Aspartate carbamoyltransferase n=1 Tax=Tetzosporium hominis TaxID=2020506 RepID=A0A264W6I7_9BACL|nr:aspartate carbamoyltransferase catalytic subunit [Tetzosporium hominis]OZS79224.1 aspartate carbamoyltransferase [Tetzosporium hominis]
MRTLTTIEQLSTDDILFLVKRARQLKAGSPSQVPPGLVAANLFFEPSTRTKMSFEMAERKVGLTVLPFEAQFSSATKGESLYDTVKTLEAIGVDVLVIRHTDNAYYEPLIGKVKPVIINGGDGTGNHPTQSLLDLMTIMEEFEELEGRTITIVGDLAHSRVARSNVHVLSRLGANLQFVSPPEWQAEFETQASLDDAIEKSDVIMLLRVQHERHQPGQSFTREQYHSQYGLTVERMHAMKDDAIILHPAPFNRGVEIADEVVEGSKSRIFEQMKNGVFMRMAILEYLLKEEA